MKLKQRLARLDPIFTSMTLYGVLVGIMCGKSFTAGALGGLIAAGVALSLDLRAPRATA